MADYGTYFVGSIVLAGRENAIIDGQQRLSSLTLLWKEKVLALKKDEDKGDETFIKAWLRARYAETIRESKAGAVNKDFDIIGGSFHKWVRDERDKLGLDPSDDFELLIKKFAKFAEVYQRIRLAETTFSEETNYVPINETYRLGWQVCGSLGAITKDHHVSSRRPPVPRWSPRARSDDDWRKDLKARPSAKLPAGALPMGLAASPELLREPRAPRTAARSKD